MSTLTPKQQDILELIKNYITDNGHSPTYQNIADLVGLKSLATVHKHITNLIAKGFITTTPNRKFSIEIIENPVSKPRFTFEGPDHIWDDVEKCYWIKE